MTTDAKLIRACRNTALRMRVMNPVSYLAEVIEDDGYSCEQPRRGEGSRDAGAGCCTGTSWVHEISPVVRERSGELYTGEV